MASGGEAAERTAAAAEEEAEDKAEEKEAGVDADAERTTKASGGLVGCARCRYRPGGCTPSCPQAKRKAEAILAERDAVEALTSAASLAAEALTGFAADAEAEQAERDAEAALTGFAEAAHRESASPPPANPRPKKAPRTQEKKPKPPRQPPPSEVAVTCGPLAADFLLDADTEVYLVRYEGANVSPIDFVLNKAEMPLNKRWYKCICTADGGTPLEDFLKGFGLQPPPSSAKKPAEDAVLRWVMPAPRTAPSPSPVKGKGKPNKGGKAPPASVRFPNAHEKLEPLDVTDDLLGMDLRLCYDGTWYHATVRRLEGVEATVFYHGTAGGKGEEETLDIVQAVSDGEVAWWGSRIAPTPLSHEKLQKVDVRPSLKGRDLRLAYDGTWYRATVRTMKGKKATVFYHTDGDGEEETLDLGTAVKNGEVAWWGAPPVPVPQLQEKLQPEEVTASLEGVDLRLCYDGTWYRATVKVMNGSIATVFYHTGGDGEEETLDLAEAVADGEVAWWGSPPIPIPADDELLKLEDVNDDLWGSDVRLAYDGTWYRATILTMDGTNATVFYHTGGDGEEETLDLADAVKEGELAWVTSRPMPEADALAALAVHAEADARLAEAERIDDDYEDAGAQQDDGDEDYEVPMDVEDLEPEPEWEPTPSKRERSPPSPTPTKRPSAKKRAAPPKPSPEKPSPAKKQRSRPPALEPELEPEPEREPSEQPDLTALHDLVGEPEPEEPAGAMNGAANGNAEPAGNDPPAATTPGMKMKFKFDSKAALAAEDPWSKAPATAQERAAYPPGLGVEARCVVNGEVVSGFEGAWCECVVIKSPSEGSDNVTVRFMNFTTDDEPDGVSDDVPLAFVRPRRPEGTKHKQLRSFKFGEKVEWYDGERVWWDGVVRQVQKNTLSVELVKRSAEGSKIMHDLTDNTRIRTRWKWDRRALDWAGKEGRGRPRVAGPVTAPDGSKFRQSSIPNHVRTSARELYRRGGNMMPSEQSLRELLLGTEFEGETAALRKYLGVWNANRRTRTGVMGPGGEDDLEDYDDEDDEDGEDNPPFRADDEPVEAPEVFVPHPAAAPQRAAPRIRLVEREDPFTSGCPVFVRVLHGDAVCRCGGRYCGHAAPPELGLKRGQVCIGWERLSTGATRRYCLEGFVAMRRAKARHFDLDGHPDARIYNRLESSSLLNGIRALRDCTGPECWCGGVGPVQVEQDDDDEDEDDETGQPGVDGAQADGGPDALGNFAW